MAFTYAVVTSVADPATGGNMAGASDLFGLWYVAEPMDESNNYTERLSKVDVDGMRFHDDHGAPLRLWDLRMPAFHVGEILILDEPGGREVGYPGRKPSKWFVEVAEYADLDTAVTRAREVLDAETKRYLSEQTIKGDG